ncbi:ABC transporter ATP-binding protein [Endozoicomonas sp. OPT23]|uniref:ABC transporter ATP-binding protein n=1 Tax=Endozoicomonas sp. OPT23 TaxID=2072845 RepID=UPI00129BCE37|nr:ABC transporter ATP-binding protein [Endozoicomonas sp. OPT23]MRI33238.1 ABC transporter ATP-binding protein [Endozoicomonas sp. OPT23]
MGQLDVTHLTKSWADSTAVDGINFSVNSGEFVALLGPSGCGKSTTLRMIAGLETPSDGRVFLNGSDITQTSPGQRGLTMVFQSYALFPHLSVKDNILFGLQVRKVSPEERKRRLSFAVELVDLGPHLDKKPSQLSGGQCQRVALARSIVSEAPLCLMDEPLSNLDAKLRGQMRTELRALQQKLGMTVLYVTHDQTEAMSMADRIILMNAGRIEQTGRPEELYNAPASTFVAGFVGSPPMNLIGQDEHILGIRPEHVSLAPAELSNSLQSAIVVSCDYLGADTLVNASFNDAKLQIRLSGHQPISAGTVLGISWQQQHEHYFCKTRQQRIERQNNSAVNNNHKAKESEYAA